MDPSLSPPARPDGASAAFNSNARNNDGGDPSPNAVYEKYSTPVDEETDPRSEHDTDYEESEKYRSDDVRRCHDTLFVDNHVERGKSSTDSERPQDEASELQLQIQLLGEAIVSRTRQSDTVSGARTVQSEVDCTPVNPGSHEPIDKEIVGEGSKQLPPSGAELAEAPNDKYDVPSDCLEVTSGSSSSNGDETDVLGRIDALLVGLSNTVPTDDDEISPRSVRPSSGLNYVTDNDSLSNMSSDSGAYSSSLVEEVGDKDLLELQHSSYRGVVDLLQTPNQTIECNSTESRSCASSTFYIDKSISGLQLESPAMSCSATDFPGVDMANMLKYSHVKCLDHFDCDVEEGVPLHISGDVGDYETEMKHQAETKYHDIHRGRKSHRSERAVIEVLQNPMLLKRIKRRKYGFVCFSFLVFLLSASILGLSLIQSVQRRQNAPSDAVETGLLDSDEEEIESQQYAEPKEPEFNIGYEGKVISLILEQNSTSTPTQSPVNRPDTAAEKGSIEEIIQQINAVEGQIPDLNMTESEKELQDAIVFEFQELAEAVIGSEEKPANEDQGVTQLAACGFCPDGMIDPNLQLPGVKDTPTCLMTSQSAESLLSGDRLCSMVQESQATCCPATWVQIQTQTCMAFGLPCPDDEKSCCSGKCEKDKETKEMVCAAPKNNNNKGNGGGVGDAEGICLSSGEECPEDEGQCCLGKCQKNKDTKEMECK